jgi:alkanesulfonate monooxygenase SsuD/methylene tetrahydromethanopterin reductase-like flavin-dependent oxidoreductase (luciferase family)
VKIDLLYEIQIPAPHDARSEYRAYWEAIEQIEAADRAGFAAVWAVEHHFLTEFAHSSAPEILLTAAAMRTERIRIGHGVVLLPGQFNHPIRVAERAAALDILSRGRLEFGTGRSSPYEQAGFEVALAESRAQWQEALEIIPRMWERRRFAHEGRYFRIPERDIIPKPIQDPHPPLWMAATSPDSWALAARNGIGILGLSIFVPVPVIQRQIATYRAGIPNAKPVGKFVNDQVGVFTIAHCAETPQQAAANHAHEAAIEYLNYAFKVFASGITPEAARAGDTPYLSLDLSREYPLIPKMLKGEVTYEELDAEDMVIIGDVDACIAKLERYRAAGADRVLCLMQASRIPHAAVLRSIELFGEHVIPRFAAASPRA